MTGSPSSPNLSGCAKPLPCFTGGLSTAATSDVSNASGCSASNESSLSASLSDSSCPVLCPLFFDPVSLVNSSNFLFPGADMTGASYLALTASVFSFSCSSKRRYSRFSSFLSLVSIYLSSLFCFLLDTCGCCERSSAFSLRFFSSFAAWSEGRMIEAFGSEVAEMAFESALYAGFTLAREHLVLPLSRDKPRHPLIDDE